MLPRINRLKKEVDIKKLFKNGKSVHDIAVGAKFKKTGNKESRFVVVVGTKVHKRAYRRNRIRRRIRAVLQDHLSHIEKGYDVALIAKPASLASTFEDIQTSVLNVLKKAEILGEVPRL